MEISLHTRMYLLQPRHTPNCIDGLLFNDFPEENECKAWRDEDEGYRPEVLVEGHPAPVLGPTAQHGPDNTFKHIMENIENIVCYTSAMFFFSI